MYDEEVGRLHGWRYIIRGNKVASVCWLRFTARMGRREICLWEISTQIYLENLKGKDHVLGVIAGIRRVVMRRASSGMLCSVEW